jgi:hypothetical protein
MKCCKCTRSVIRAALMVQCKMLIRIIVQCEVSELHCRRAVESIATRDVPCERMQVKTCRFSNFESAESAV